MKPDFAKIHAPKEKPHLESSHRRFHNFEIRVIKAFEDRIVKTEPGFTFTNGKKEKITVTFLDISINELKSSLLLEEYRHEHNSTKHYFSEEGNICAWVPNHKLEDFLRTTTDTLNFSPGQVKEYMKYGLRKTKATISKQGIVRFEKQNFYVTVGADLFSRHKSTPVQISKYNDKLFIFEPKEDGVLLGEALAQKPPEKLVELSSEPPEANELDRIIALLEQNNMIVDRPALIEIYHKGLTLTRTKEIIQLNQKRYATYVKKMKQPESRKGAALFNAFLLDCQSHQRKYRVAPYAFQGAK